MPLFPGPIPPIVAMMLLLLGGVLLIIGVAGRRVGRSPHCARCGYEIGDAPRSNAVTQTAPAGKCPECGRSLATPGALIPGRRERRGRTVWTGGLAIASAVTIGGAWGVRSFATIPASAKPAWWLAEDLGSPIHRTEAIFELDARTRSGTLSPATARGIAKRVLAIQSKHQGPWDPAMGDLFVLLARNDLLDAAALERFAAAAFIPNASVRARSIVEHGTTHIPLSISHASEARADTGGFFRVIGYQLAGARLNGREVLPGLAVRRDEPLRPGPPGRSSLSPTVAFYDITSPVDGWVPLVHTPGVYTLTIVSRYYIVSAFSPDARPSFQTSTEVNDRRGGGESDEPAVKETALAMIEVSSDTTFTVAPLGEAVVSTRSDPESVARYSRYLRAATIRVRPGFGGVGWSIDLELSPPRFLAGVALSHTPRLGFEETTIELFPMTIGISPMPIEMTPPGSLGAAGTDEPDPSDPTVIPGPFVFPVSSGTHPGPLPRVGHARVVLVPSTEAAARTVDITETLADEVDLGWIPIVWELDPAELGEVQQVPEAVGEARESVDSATDHDG